MRTEEELRSREAEEEWEKICSNGRKRINKGREGVKWWIKEEEEEEVRVEGKERKELSKEDCLKRRYKGAFEEMRGRKNKGRRISVQK